MTLVEDTVRLPSGAVVPYLHLAPGRPDGVTVIAVDTRGRLLVQREYSYPPDEVLWQLPGGAVESGEDPVTAARRELREESGVDAATMNELGWCYPNNRRSSARMHILLGQDLTILPAAPDDTEFITSTWLEPADLHELVATGQITNMYMLAALQLWHHHQSGQR